MKSKRIAWPDFAFALTYRNYLVASELEDKLLAPISVLIVEDEPLVSMALVDDLEHYGYQVLEVANAAAALRVLEQRQDIQLIITDVDMPGSMDGLMLAATVHNRWPPIRIIVVSGHRAVDITDIPDGSVFYSKPYKSTDIVNSMREMLS